MSMDTPAEPAVSDFDACLAQPASTVETSRGPVEYAERGVGTPLLSVHGSPAAYQEGLLQAEFFRANGFRVIAPSRPGYSGTPLDTGRRSAEQADALAALLDALHLERVAVLGMSGGGPAAYALAGRHHDRVSCLLQIDSIALPLAGSWMERMAFSKRPLVALQLWLVDHFTGRMLTMMGSTGTPDPEVAAAQAALTRAIILSCGDWPRLRVGYDNDDAEFAALGELPLAAITCPTLIIHGTADHSVPITHAEHAHARIGSSELRWIPGGPHTAFLINPDAQQYALSWLLAHHGDQP
jgi:pimeloyl-ACP methyl ester carboxylesterase